MNRKKYYLVDTSFNWADEMNINSFEVIDENTYKNYQRQLEDVVDDDAIMTKCIGTNEEQEISTSDIQNMLDSAEKITCSMKNTLMRVSQCESSILEDFFEEFGDDNNPFTDSSTGAYNHTNEYKRFKNSSTASYNSSELHTFRGRTFYHGQELSPAQIDSYHRLEEGIKFPCELAVWNHTMYGNEPTKYLKTIIKCNILDPKPWKTDDGKEFEYAKPIGSK